MPFHDNCANCFEPLNGSSICSQCRFDMSKLKSWPDALAPFSMLADRYVLGRTLGKGGFGITYLAKDLSKNLICAIKEYMPCEYASRSKKTLSVYPFSDQKSKFVFEHGKGKFVDEVNTLVKLIHNPIVVDIWGSFHQNNTAYLVMEFLDGEDLRKMTGANGCIDVKSAESIFVTVAGALREIHRMNILHRDLSPDNIFMTHSGNIKLIDFGAARDFVINQNLGMSVLLKPGYAPPEQYQKMGKQGPWSDVYALCATFYKIVSGKAPVDALYRYRGEQQPSLAVLGCKISRRMSDIIEKGLELDYEKRYQNFDELLNDMQPGKEIPKSSPAKGLVIPIVSATIPGRPPVQSAIRKNDVLKIGRGKQSCNLVLDHDDNISRMHCYLRFDEKQNVFYLADAGSVNGTYLENGLRLERNQEYAIAPDSKFYLVKPNQFGTVLTVHMAKP